MNDNSIEYYRSREQAEREAAKRATSEEARVRHLELADGYAALVQQRQLERGSIVQATLRIEDAGPEPLA